MSRARYERLKFIRNTAGLIVYLCGGWRSYTEISEEFSWSIGVARRCKTAYRHIHALEEAGLPIEWLNDPNTRMPGQRVRLPADWVARTPWLRRYIIRNEPLKVANRKAERARSLHK